MIKRIVFTLLATVALTAAPTLAQCKDKPGGDKAGCSKLKTGKAHDACSKDKAGVKCSKDGKKDNCADVNCAGDQVRYKGTPIPRLVYQVGDQRLTCPKSSVKLAKEKGVDIKYVVGEKVFTDKAKALDAHRQRLEKFYDNLLNVNYSVAGQRTGCCKTAEAVAKKEGKPLGYCVGSFCFKDKASAEKAAKLAREAGDNVQMISIVGDKTFECPHEAANVAKAEGKPVKYCVGKMKTTSETMAKIQLTVERIKVALDEVEKCGGKQIAAK